MVVGSWVGSVAFVAPITMLYVPVKLWTHLSSSKRSQITSSSVNNLEKPGEEFCSGTKQKKESTSTIYDAAIRLKIAARKKLLEGLIGN